MQYNLDENVDPVTPEAPVPRGKIQGTNFADRRPAEIEMCSLKSGANFPFSKSIHQAQQRDQ